MLATLIASVASGEAAAAAGNAKRALIAYLVAGLLALAGIGFLLIAGFVALADEIGVMAAALWLGGGFLALALLIVAVHRIAASLRRRRIARRRRSEAAAMAGAAALAALPAMLAGRGRLALLAPVIGVIGYAIYREQARRPGRDDGLEDT